MAVELYPHQEEAIQKLRDGNILCGGVGTGKSLTALGYYIKAHPKKDVYIITTAKKRDSLDWVKEAAKYGIGQRKDATKYGVLVVDSWNNISKYTDVVNAFFIFDEQRLVGSGAWTKSFLSISKHNSWILLSATPGDTWIDYIPVFVANGFYRNRTEFKRQHCVYSYYGRYPKLERYLGVGKLEALRKRILVDMPYVRHTQRHQHKEFMDFDRSLEKKTIKNRWNYFENEPIVDIAELFYLRRKISNINPSRIERLREILKEKKRVIVFYNFDYELELLRELKDITTVAEWNGHKHEEIPDTESWVYLVQYVAGAEGWNCVSTDTIVFYSLTYSYKNFEQAMGRIDRLNTPFSNLHYHIFLSRSGLDLAIFKALDSKKAFTERGFKG